VATPSQDLLKLLVDDLVSMLDVAPGTPNPPDGAGGADYRSNGQNACLLEGNLLVTDSCTYVYLPTRTRARLRRQVA
jgi:hypothetical protein